MGVGVGAATGVKLTWELPKLFNVSLADRGGLKMCRLSSSLA